MNKRLKSELEILSNIGIKFDERIIDGVKKCLEIFEEVDEGHSGFSIQYLDKLFYKIKKDYLEMLIKLLIT